MPRGWLSYGGWRPYVSVGARRRQAAMKLDRLRKAGRQVSPIEIAGRKIAHTFWGAAWCQNLESYSDFTNRLPRGRSYVRNGAVIDLGIEPGRVSSLVSGSELYELEIEIQPLTKKHWTTIKLQCAGRIDSLVELLRGSISERVMAIVTRREEGLFPAPREISMRCSCPDWAIMCKHVAATLYGVGARLDRRPELLFTLRGVDPAEMVAAAVDQPPGKGKPRRGRVLASSELSSVFGVDIDFESEAQKRSARRASSAKPKRKPKIPARKKTGLKRRPPAG